MTGQIAFRERERHTPALFQCVKKILCVFAECSGSPDGLGFSGPEGTLRLHAEQYAQSLQFAVFQRIRELIGQCDLILKRFQ